MSAVEIVIQALLASPAGADVSNRIRPIFADQEDALPHLVVHLVFEAEEMLVDAASQFMQSRVSVECRGRTATEAIGLGQTVIDALRDTREATFAGCTATIQKEGTDATDFSDESAVYTRILDFYVWWRKAP